MSGQRDKSGLVGGHDMNRTFVIVGGSIAGLTAAEKLRELTDERIVLVEPDPMRAYDKTALSKDLLIADEMPDIFLRSAAHLDELRIEVRKVSAVALDATGRVVRLSDGSSVSYDRLLIATGASPVIPFPHEADTTIHVVRTHADAEGLRSELRDARRAVVIGGGLIGCEVVSAARHLGVETDIVDSLPGPFQRMLGAAFSQYIEKLQIDADIATYYGRGVVDVRRGIGDHRFDVELSTGEILHADIIVAGTGVRPETGWLQGSGVDTSLGVVCDSRLSTSLSDVFAAGDVASWPGGPGGELIRLEHWANAAEQGVGAAISMASEKPTGDDWTPGMPHFMTTIHSHRLTVLGHVHGGEIGDPTIHVAVGPNERGLIALYGSADRLVGCATVDQARIAVRLSGLFGRGNSWTESVSIVENHCRIN
ncbi:NAD(P)/FAD-dependent oxidoreductase [Streptomyces mirabilis]|uniref:NAD(P)/FAD-dependent oxidoreductase n=1 Tax=Streptomyces sp. NPDC005388 TaxID=3156717 RepID=UPI0033A98276